MSKQKLTGLEIHYIGLSEMYLAHYQELNEPNLKIMQAMGVVVEMESDLVAFEREKGITDKSKKQMERIQVIKNSIDAFSIASDRTIQFKLILTKLYNEAHAREAKIEQLHEDILKLEAIIEGI